MDAAPALMPRESFIKAAVAGGVDIIQLREKSLTDRILFEVARECAATCRALGVPFIINDRLDIALASGADGVHVGQDDFDVRDVRAIAGDKLLVGLSTHSQAQIDDSARLDIDYIGVGPIHETPTKQGRPAVGTAVVSYAAANARVPFFAIGGLDPSNVAEVINAGADRISVRRFILHAADPSIAARQMLDAHQRAREFSFR